MKEAYNLDLDGFYTNESEPIPAGSPMQVTERFETPVPTSEIPEPEAKLVGYRISCVWPSGLFKPRYDIAACQAALVAYDDAMASYRAALAAYDPDSEDEPPRPPAPVDLQAYWVEGLTQAEIDAIRNAPQPPTIYDHVTQLQTESVDTMLALTEVFETTAEQDAMREQEGVDTMLALTEAYETILQQQTAIDTLMTQIAVLTARIDVLEGGAS
ncbi:hypothetical protein PV433_27300 [Paenibacillus sp. GYB004]|uniref:hypothetical protein n=1 Tax=Paenibacillus sp. GYB004 TaxID=2994393 RepID=UPI002F9660CD